MIPQRVGIVIGVSAVLWNVLLMMIGPFVGPDYITAGFVGAEALGLVSLVAFTIYVAKSTWYRANQQSILPSSLWAATSGAAVGLLATYVSAVSQRNYGIALFVATPLLVGFHAAFALGARRAIDLKDALAASLLALLCLAIALVAFAIEGVVCLAMALPIAVPLAMLGALFAYWLRKYALAHQPTVLLLCIGLAPFGATVEHALPHNADVVQVATSIDIPAPPQQVWRTILQPARLSAPSHVLFRAGVAYPLASHIEGTGPSAIRYCDFSTGKLIEPVLIWDQGRRLRFTVRSNPLPMQEWTPYARLHPPHLDGFLVSRQGEFRLEALSGGQTRLIATTWYQDHLYPARYWKLWSDYIIHQVHKMVLENVRQRALQGLEKNGAFEKPHGLAADGNALATILAP